MELPQPVEEGTGLSEPDPVWATLRTMGDGVRNTTAVAYVDSLSICVKFPVSTVLGLSAVVGILWFLGAGFPVIGSVLALPLVLFQTVFVAFMVPEDEGRTRSDRAFALVMLAGLLTVARSVVNTLLEVEGTPELKLAVLACTAGLVGLPVVYGLAARARNAPAPPPPAALTEACAAPYSPDMP